MGCHTRLQEIFLTQGSNPGFLHCKQIFYHLSHQGSPKLPRRPYIDNFTQPLFFFPKYQSNKQILISREFIKTSSPQAYHHISLLVKVFINCTTAASQGLFVFYILAEMGTSQRDLQDFEVGFLWLLSGGKNVVQKQILRLWHIRSLLGRYPRNNT